MPLALATIAYFTPPANHWWQWTDDGPAWRDGRPIAFIEEWRSVLDDLAADRTGGGGLPPSGAVLLALAACGKAWKDEPSRYGLMMAATMDWGDSAALERRDDVAMMQEVWRGLDAVHALPAELRAGMAGRLALCFLLLDRAPHRLGAKVSKSVLEEFDRVPLADVRRARQGAQAAALKLPSRALLLRRDLEALQAGFQAIGADTLADPAKFAVRVRTGAADATLRLDKLPKFARPAGAATARPAPAPELPKPPPDLLSALAEAGGEAGAAAQMARRILAALSLSRPAGRPDDHPEGGFADLANRGDPQRLLLSELGHDPDVLAARIVHGEAMYLKREVPPARPARRRVLCLDATLRQWGAARLVAMAMALALREQAKQAQAKTKTAGGGVEVRQSNLGRWRKLPFEKAEDVQAALGHLDVGPLPPTVDGLDLGADKTPAEVFLITSAAAWRDGAQVAALRALSSKAALSAVAVVDREGNFSLHAVGGLGSRELGKGRVEMDREEVKVEKKRMELVPKGQAQVRRVVELPKFYLEKQQPLPVVPRRRIIRKILTDNGHVAMDPSGRLFCWPNPKSLPRLVGFGPVGIHMRLAVHGTKAVMVASGSRDSRASQALRYREFNLATGEQGSIKVVANSHRLTFSEVAMSDRDTLMLLSGSMRRIEMIRLSDGTSRDVPAGRQPDGTKIEFPPPPVSGGAVASDQFFAWSGLHKMSVEWEAGKDLLFSPPYSWGRFCLCFDQNAEMPLSVREIKEEAPRTNGAPRLKNQVRLRPSSLAADNTRLREARFRNGACIVEDRHGYLHLLPANPTLPQISFLLLWTGKHGRVIAWTSDGHRYGDPSLWNGETLSDISILKRHYDAFIAALP